VTSRDFRYQRGTLVFIYRKDEVIIFFLIYVDGNVVVSSSSKAMEALLTDLRQEFALKDLGALHYFLGIEVGKVRGGILLYQKMYALEIINRVGMKNCKPVNTPLPTSKKFSAHSGTPLDANKEAINYRSIAISYSHKTRLSLLC
jgi:hypothetical protein